MINISKKSKLQVEILANSLYNGLYYIRMAPQRFIMEKSLINDLQK